MSENFNRLKELIKNKKVKIGINRSYANDYWYNQTFIGKFLNWLTILFTILAIYIFLKFGIIQGLLTVLGTGIYSVCMQKIARVYLWFKLLKWEKFFIATYQARHITIRDNKTGEILIYPADWEQILQ
jgi:hypothetical protein